MFYFIDLVETITVEVMKYNSDICKKSLGAPYIALLKISTIYLIVFNYVCLYVLWPKNGLCRKNRTKY